MFIISGLVFNEPKMCAFDDKTKATEYIKSVKNETVIQRIFEVDYDGNVTFYEVDFDGKIVLNPVGGGS